MTCFYVLTNISLNRSIDGPYCKHYIMSVSGRFAVENCQCSLREPTVVHFSSCGFLQNVYASKNSKEGKCSI